MKIKFWLWLCLSFTAVTAQNSMYTTLTIADSLKQNANAVVRLSQTDISIASQRSMNIKERRVVTVFNEKGMAVVGAVDFYDKRKSIRNIEATIYDALGTPIKKLKRKDFRDVSATVDGSTFFSEDRILYLDYTPVQYPFTIVYENESQTSNTAFIRSWMPVYCFFAGLEKSTLSITCPAALGLKKKELNFEGYPVKSTQSGDQITYTLSNIPAVKREALHLGLERMCPKVIFGLESFNLEGIDGTAKSWKDFGQWYADKILSGTDEIPEPVIAKAKMLVGNETDPVKKARIIYNYLQQKSRYISIQVGIGGWKPMPASDVDRLGYGDCKALTNYTRSLLRAVDVPSYYTILYSDDNKLNIDPDFVSMQGNHAMLAVPNGNDYIWLECTSQDVPFGYQAGSTDDRQVLVIKPEGGEITRTQSYPDHNNTQISTGEYILSDSGMLSGKISIVSEGAQYGNKYFMERQTPAEKEAHYKEYWSNIGNLKLLDIAFANNKEHVSFTENIAIEASGYGKVSGDRMLFAVNPYNQLDGSVKRERNRKSPFEIKRGSVDEDRIVVELPPGYTIETLPSDFELSGIFGTYKTGLTKEEGKLIYRRSLLLKQGRYPSRDYEEFRKFMDQISRNDNAKIVLLKNQ